MIKKKLLCGVVLAGILLIPAIGWAVSGDEGGGDCSGKTINWTKCVGTTEQSNKDKMDDTLKSTSGGGFSGRRNRN